MKLEFFEEETFYDLVGRKKCPVCGGMVETMQEHKWYPTFACQVKDCAALFEANWNDIGDNSYGETMIEPGMIVGWRQS